MCVPRHCVIRIFSVDDSAATFAHAAYGERRDHSYNWVPGQVNHGLTLTGEQRFSRHGHSVVSVPKARIIEVNFTCYEVPASKIRLPGNTPIKRVITGYYFVVVIPSIACHVS